MLDHFFGWCRSAGETGLSDSGVWPSVVGLFGSTDELHEQVLDVLKSFPSVSMERNGPGEYVVDHSAIRVFDRNGQLVAIEKGQAYLLEEFLAMASNIKTVNNSEKRESFAHITSPPLTNDLTRGTRVEAMQLAIQQTRIRSGVSNPEDEVMSSVLPQNHYSREYPDAPIKQNLPRTSAGGSSKRWAFEDPSAQNQAPNGQTPHWHYAMQGSARSHFITPYASS